MRTWVTDSAFVVLVARSLRAQGGNWPLAGKLHRDGPSARGVILPKLRDLAKERIPLSFFDDDEPPTRTRPRRPTSAPLGPQDPQQLMVRRAVAAGVGLLVLVLLVIGVRGCLNSRKEQALKDYNRDVASLVQEANENTGDFFQTLSTGGSSPGDLQTQVNQLRVRAEGHTKKAVDLDVPGEMLPAHRNLVVTLSLVQESVGKVAEKLPSALASDATVAENGVKSIAGEMQAFTAADVVYTRRVAALIQQILDREEIGGQTIQRSNFQQNLGWLDPDIVARRIGSDAGRGAGGGATREPAPGTHGHALISTAVGDKSLVSGGAPNRIAASSNITFRAVIANQGENIETDVRVRVRIRGSGKTISAQKTVDETRPGTNTEVSIPLGQAPPIGEAVTITVEVRPVPGESKTDNNSQNYTALFTR